MATLNLRVGAAAPLTNQQVDDNFTALNNALGATSTTIPTPTGSGVPVLNISPTISTHLFGGTSANLTRFPNAFGSISSTGSSTSESHNIGLIAEATAHASTTTTWGIGLYGVGYTSAVTRSVGVSGEAHVSAATDVGVAIGVRGYSTDAHTGALGYNIGLYADASGSTAGNYALWMNTGNIYSAVAQTWTLTGNLTFSGAYTVTVPTLSLTYALAVTSGGTGVTSAQAEMNRVAAAITSGYYLRGDGTNVVMAAIVAGDVPTLNQNTSGTAAGLSSTLVATSGGTGATTTTAGDLLQGGATTNTWSKLAAVAVNNVLLSGGVGTASTWGKVGLTTHITGTLPVNNGGTGATTITAGLVYASGTTAFATASAAQIVAAIGTTAVTNATTAGSCSGNAATATNATTAGSCSGNAATATNATTATTAGSCSGNAATATNATNANYARYVYLASSGNYTSPENLNVSYASLAGGVTNGTAAMLVASVTASGAVEANTFFATESINTNSNVIANGIISAVGESKTDSYFRSQQLVGTGVRSVTCTASGAIQASSDERLKTRVFEEPLPGLVEVLRLQPRAYKWNDDIENRGDNAAIEIGFFANETATVIPSSAPMGNDGFYGFYDRPIIAALVKATQEQQTLINTLTDRIAALEAK